MNLAIASRLTAVLSTRIWFNRRKDLLAHLLEVLIEIKQQGWEN